MTETPQTLYKEDPAITSCHPPQLAGQEGQQRGTPEFDLWVGHHVTNTRAPIVHNMEATLAVWIRATGLLNVPGIIRKAISVSDSPVDSDIIDTDTGNTLPTK